MDYAAGVIRAVATTGLLASSLTSFAQDAFPIDTELVHPAMSPAAGFAVEAPQSGLRGTWFVGGLVQYENSPLRIYDSEALLGSLVAHRGVFHLRAGVAASDRVAVGLTLPIAVHFGAEDIAYARNGAGLGDASLSLRWHATDWRKVRIGVLATVLVPTGSQGLYMGERLPRLRTGVLTQLDLGRFVFGADLLAHLREPVATGLDFTASSELELDLGARIAVVPSRINIIAELLTRVGVGRGEPGGRLASEALLGLRYLGDGGLRLDLGVGRGLTEGYGTTGVRVLAGLSYVHPPRPVPPEPEPPDEPEPLPEVVDPPEPEPAPEPELADIVGDVIEIREPIQFEVGTTTLLDSSDPVLDAVASLIDTTGVIGHVVIEGHTSLEGGFAYNYELSVDRARTVYEALIVRGVHPNRLSYRGVGEVERVTEGEDPAEIARDRRVVFHVVRQYQPGEEVPEYPRQIVLPWSGEPHDAGEPPPIVVPEPPSTEIVPEEEP